MVEHIKDEVNRLIKKYKTNNPFDIASGEKIIVLFESLGSIHGYYNRFVRQSFIHINCDMSNNSQFITCCHELGHAILHPSANTTFLLDSTFFSVNKLECQANIFAAEMLISNETMRSYFGTGYSITQIAQELEVCEPLVEFKINHISL